MFKTGKIRGRPREFALKLFDEWTYRSQLPTYSEVFNYIKSFLEKTVGTKKIYDELTKKLPFDKNLIKNFVDQVEADRKRGKSLEETLTEHLWKIYETTINIFLQQTAHVIVGRFLLYKIGVDKKVFEQITPPHKSYLKLYHVIRENMEKMVPWIYSLSEFDWWYIPDIYRGLLDSAQQDLLNKVEERLDLVMRRIIEKLNDYDFTQIDRDVWKEVYLLYLSEEERRKLGFVPTPDEIVSLILDLVGYDENQREICKRKILDPACGSGTFLVEAVLRLKRHLEREMSCHKEVHDKKLPEWELKKRVLDIITEAVHGIDIHPFATFLTTLNLLFQLIDLYGEVKHYYPSYILKLRIVTHDALALAHEPSLRKFQEEIANARLKEALRRSEEYNEINKMKFYYVVGNPPWGGVLRGKLGPLGDSMKREEYKKKYVSATGKFDIYVLFIERGLKWLEEQGVLGMISQITYLDSDFGKGIRDYIKSNATISHLIDLSEMGDVIFPGFTNYPVITIMKKIKPSSDLKVIRVKVKKLG
jgi:type I restriction-modification system DNA methylase subunit